MFEGKPLARVARRRFQEELYYEIQLGKSFEMDNECVGMWILKKKRCGTTQRKIIF